MAGRYKATLTPKLETALVKVFLESLEPMVECGKLGALLLQLSPSFSPRKHTLTELDHTLELLSGHKVAVELRNWNWVEEEQRDKTIAFFRSRRIAMVTVDSPPGDHFMIMPSLDVVTNRRLAYLRAHGRNTRGYISGRSVADAVRLRLFQQGAERDRRPRLGLSDIAIDTHIIFNNNKSNYAPKAAERFRKIVTPQGASTRSQPRMSIGKRSGAVWELAVRGNIKSSPSGNAEAEFELRSIRSWPKCWFRMPAWAWPQSSS